MFFSISLNIVLVFHLKLRSFYIKGSWLFSYTDITICHLLMDVWNDQLIQIITNIHPILLVNQIPLYGCATISWSVGSFLECSEAQVFSFWSTTKCARVWCLGIRLANRCRERGAPRSPWPRSNPSQTHTPCGLTLMQARWKMWLDG